MKNISLLLLILIYLNSCSFANKNEVSISINSSPPNAQIYIEGKYYGQTPKMINLAPSKNYTATLISEDYVRSQLDLEVWYSIRGDRGADQARCGADAAGVVPMFLVLVFNATKCSDFKQKNYMVNFDPVM
jgi:hypothetical protein